MSRNAPESLLASNDITRVRLVTKLVTKLVALQCRWSSVIHVAVIANLGITLAITPTSDVHVHVHVNERAARACV